MLAILTGYTWPENLDFIRVGPRFQVKLSSNLSLSKGKWFKLSSNCFGIKYFPIQLEDMFPEVGLLGIWRMPSWN